jgi:diacylglycerol kinase family enzyme
VAETERRNHATALAAGAVADGYDIVISLGGDGTLNEVVNGLIGSDTALIVVPGGHTNVFARTYGLPREPVEATGVILAHLESGGKPVLLDLGSVNGRAFAFCAGVGFDADVVRAVEAHPRRKRRWGETYFVATAVRRFFLGYRRMERPMHVTAGDVDLDGIHQVFVCASDPYTYLRERPFRMCPGAQQGNGLSLTAFRSLSTTTALRTVARGFGRARLGRMRAIETLDGIDHAQITTDTPVPLQVDGDYVGEATSLAFSREREAILAFIPPQT